MLRPSHIPPTARVFLLLFVSYKDATALQDIGNLESVLFHIILLSCYLLAPWKTLEEIIPNACLLEPLQRLECPLSLTPPSREIKPFSYILICPSSNHPEQVS